MIHLNATVSDYFQRDIFIRETFRCQTNVEQRQFCSKETFVEGKLQTEINKNHLDSMSFAVLERSSKDHRFLLPLNCEVNRYFARTLLQ